MPGIVGIISQQKSPLECDALVGSMLAAIKHRPSYRTGKYSDERIGVSLGWAHHEGAFSNCLPIGNEKKDVCLVFSGEEFRDKAEVEHLKDHGHTFESGDASYLVHLYEELGFEFFKTLNGWFSGVLIDLRKQQFVLFNDRYGVDRVYYHEDRSGFYFSSEAKSLLKILPVLRQISLRSLGEVVSCNGVLQNRSLFSGISSLPPASAWVFSRGEPVKKKTYFKRETWESQSELGPADYYDKLKETWRRILPRYFEGQQTAALSLTGGVDSRMILAWAPRAAGTFPCYTWGGKYRDCADVKIARKTAKLCRQPHETILVGDEFLLNFFNFAEKAVHISDGTMDVTGAVDLYVQNAARNIAPVRLSGVYGGEILRRLVMFGPDPPDKDLFDLELGRSFDEAAETFASELEGHRLSFTAFKQAPWYMANKFSLERSQLTLRSPYFDNDLVSLAYQAPAQSLNNGPALRIIAEGNTALGTIGTDRGVASRRIPGLTTIRHAYQQFMFKAEYAYDYRMPQWLAKIDHLFGWLHPERLFIGRHKFHHFRIWYRDELAPRLKEILLDPGARCRPYMRPGALEKMLAAHESGRRNYALEIHKILTLELIQRKLIDQS
jgi:asparagine synthase (glutamine-hydrolysing)